MSDPTDQRRLLYLALQQQQLLQRLRRQQQQRHQQALAATQNPQALAAMQHQPRLPRVQSQPPQGSGGFDLTRQQQAQRALHGIGMAQAEAARARAPEEQMAVEDAWKACNPDFKTPFTSVEDAVSRLLPYHVFADYDSDEDEDLAANSSADGSEPKSRVQQWDDAVAAKVDEFFAEFEKQTIALNIMLRKRAEGVARAEERLMMERALLEDERQACLRTRAVIEAEQQDAAARLRMAMAQAQAQAQAQSQGQPERAFTVPGEWAGLVSGQDGAAAHGGSSGSGQATQGGRPPEEQGHMMLQWWANAAQRKA